MPTSHHTRSAPASALFKGPRSQMAISVLFLAVAPLVVTFFGDDTRQIMTYAAALFHFGIAFWWLSVGLRNRDAFNAAEIARRPRFPFLIAGAVLTGIVLAGLVWSKTGALDYAAIQGVLATLLAMMAFGIDPLRDKDLESAAEIRLHAAQALTEAAKARLLRMRARIDELTDAGLAEPIETFTQTVILMLKALADDPDRHRELRRHLGHFLEQTGEVTDRFVMQYRSTGDEDTRLDYIAFLASMDKEFTRELRAFVTEDRDAMEVQLSALRSRMRG
ncbi:hypothetical protein ACEWPL_001655 [Roseovarius sp. S1116L3]|uniref:hypothetical protein n=1 Tax=Roseovarius roseus TaxID=3342636 RepID=UPI0037294CF7